MAASGGSKDLDPGEGGRQEGGAQQQTSYADRLKANVSYNERLKRNILEITLEKAEKEAEMVIDQECVEGYQVQYIEEQV